MHPDIDAPALGWVDGLRRSGDRLQAKLRDIAPEFREAVEARTLLQPLRRAQGRRAAASRIPGRPPSGRIRPGSDPVRGRARPGDRVRRNRSRLRPAQLGVPLHRAAAARDPRAHHREGGPGDRRQGDPDWEIETVSEAADEDEAAAMAGNEPAPNETTEDELPPTEDELNARASDLDAREAKLADREKGAASAAALAAAEASLDEHVRAGRVLPAERAGLAALLASLPCRNAFPTESASVAERRPRRRVRRPASPSRRTRRSTRRRLPSTIAPSPSRRSGTSPTSRPPSSRPREAEPWP